MAVVTFMSDFGVKDHYTAAVKAALLKVAPQVPVIDITHYIDAFDVGHAGYVLGNVFRDFPEGTVHLCAIDSTAKEISLPVAIALEGHFFVGMDCGLFDLISTERPTAQVLLQEPPTDTFVAKTILAPVAANLASGASIHDMGRPISELKRLLGRQLKVTKREITGNIVRVDHFGNLITNIHRKDFDTITRINGNAPFTVEFGREQTNSFQQTYGDVDSGECYVFFNSNGFLQIGLNKGRATELLGLKQDAPISILFKI